VIRAAASKGAADIIAVRTGQILFVQCKYTEKLPVSSLSVCPPEERKAVLRLANMVQGSALLAHPVKEGSKAVDVGFMRITGPESYNFTPWVLSRASA
jgi:Holliday junction resolvase